MSISSLASPARSAEVFHISSTKKVDDELIIRMTRGMYELRLLGR
jgi:hypothetical protein